MSTPNAVELGSVIVAFMEPHAGHERAFHRWYERDLLYRVGASAPGTLAASLWLAPAALRALRRPRPENPIGGSSDRGTHLATFWIQRGMLDAQQSWVAERMGEQRVAGTLFPHRHHLDTHRYDVRRCVRRDRDGVPPELALHHGFPGLVASWIGCRAGQTLAGVGRALAEDALPRFVARTPIELAIVLDRLPPSGAGPAGPGEAAAPGERLLVLHFLGRSPDECWEATFAGLEETLAGSGAGELLLASPFVANVPGVDPVLAGDPAPRDPTSEV